MLCIFVSFIFAIYGVFGYEDSKITTNYQIFSRKSYQKYYYLTSLDNITLKIVDHGVGDHIDGSLTDVFLLKLAYIKDLL